MASIFEDVHNSLKDGINFIVKKTGELTKKGKLSIDWIGINREIEKLFSELGGRTFEIITKEKGKDIASDPEVMQFVTKLQELEGRLVNKKKEISDVDA